MNEHKGPPPPPAGNARAAMEKWRLDAAVTIAAAICQRVDALVHRETIASAALEIVDRIITES